MPQIPQNMMAMLAGQLPNAQMRVPSQAERDELRRVQDMQVRTVAADHATRLLAGNPWKATEWHAIAKAIELYIIGH